MTSSATPSWSYELAREGDPPGPAQQRPPGGGEHPWLGRDPHGSDGVTAAPCTEMAGGACHAVELSPAYADVAVQRWHAFTGQQAVLEGAGGNFAAAAARRRSEEASHAGGGV